MSVVQTITLPIPGTESAAQVIPTEGAIFFDMPALLGIMVAIAIGMWRYFKRRGWFD